MECVEHVDAAARVGWGERMRLVWRCEFCGRTVEMTDADRAELARWRAARTRQDPTLGTPTLSKRWPG